MSGIYLVLRSRLEELTKWITLGTDVMKGAREARGLSYESVGRLVHISSKTYERWEKRGQVPAHTLDVVAEALGLEIERASRPAVTVEETEESLPELRQELSAEVARLRRLSDQLEAVLADLADQAKPRRDRKPAEQR